ncbi:hypothetical protein YC2023_016530 [Brassica napus]
MSVLDNLQHLNALFDERRFNVSFGDSSQRRLLRCLSSASSSPVTLLGDLSLCGPPRRVGALSGLLVISLRGTSPPSFPSVAQIEAFTSDRKLTDRRIKVHRAKVQTIEEGSSDTQPQMEPRKRIVCGLSERGIIPPLLEEDRDDDVAPLPQEDPVEVVDISDEEEEDIVELSHEEYKSNMGYFIRVEESEDDIEPGVRRMLERMQEEEMKLREEKFKVLKSGIKQEKGQSFKGDGNKRKGRK